ncbi:hypothetical protein SNE40_001670 [Patella caerulea]|uniref:Uncharacterized protein n=1 Tax=Patella caerulea TaxID=87958 RepID=A0AAN8KJ84_PATCE
MALVEYCGTRTIQNLQHGNSKSDRAYIRTDPRIVQRCVENGKHKSPADIYFSAVADDSVLAPRSTKQIRDKIYNDKRKQTRCADSNLDITSKPNNVADEVLTILKMQKNGSVIKRVEHTEGKLPNIIIYSKEQLQDMKSNCLGEGGSVVGIDRTFSLGKCFVTALSYKNQAVINRETN